MHTLCQTSHAPVVTVGWPTTKARLIVPSGGSGEQTFTIPVTKVDGSPLDTYDGWTWRLRFYQHRTPVTGGEATGSVTGDSVRRTLSATIEFDTDLTEVLPPGRGFATLEFILGDEVQRPIEFDVEVT